MKTVLEIPETLFKKANALAEEKGIPFSGLVLTSLEHSLEVELAFRQVDFDCHINSYGWPVISLGGMRVSDDLVNSIRKEIGM
ncbi:antitoxin [Leptospira wolffii]|uniref:antitoxin n=1 Tax=Leptospira wolffii TaxID=409998 RepID=UPI001082AAE3|nr:antitoxin [Leptospira wolffii]TGL46595.1 antitoxin [Leptospira wolffii]